MVSNNTSSHTTTVSGSTNSSSSATSSISNTTLAASGQTYTSQAPHSNHTTPVWTDVFHAIKRNNLAAVKQFIEEKGVPVTKTDGEKKSGAMVAAEYGHLPILKYFLEKNSTLLKVPDQFGNTVLARAIQKGDLNMVRYLVEEQKADILSIDHHINTAVHVAAQEGQSLILRYFIEERKADVNIPNLNGETPLFSAAEKPFMFIIMYLIEERRADPLIVDVTKDNILYKSARYGDVTLPKYLLDTKKVNLDVNWKNEVGYTAVNWACRFNHTEFVKYMVEQKKADVNIADSKKGRTPLHNAAAKNNVALCKFLVEHGAKVDVKDIFDSTPVELTSEPEVTKYLSEKNSTKNNRKRRSLTESMTAPRLDSQVPMMRMVIENGNPYNLLSSGNHEAVGTPNIINMPGGVLDSFLKVVDTAVRYLRGSAYQQTRDQSLLSPREHIQRRMDLVAMFAVDNGVSDFEE